MQKNTITKHNHPNNINIEATGISYLSNKHEKGDPKYTISDNQTINKIENDKDYVKIKESMINSDIFEENLTQMKSYNKGKNKFNEINEKESEYLNFSKNINKSLDDLKEKESKYFKIDNSNQNKRESLANDKSMYTLIKSSVTSSKIDENHNNLNQNLKNYNKELFNKKANIKQEINDEIIEEVSKNKDLSEIEQTNSNNLIKISKN